MRENPHQPPQVPTAEPDDAAQNPDVIKRQFLKRFGGYAATAPAALFVLMSPRTSKALNSDGAP